MIKSSSCPLRTRVAALSGLVGVTLPERSNNLKILYAVPIEILRFLETCLKESSIAIFCHTTRQRISSEYGAFRPGSADIPTLALGCAKLASHEYYYGWHTPCRHGTEMFKRNWNPLYVYKYVWDPWQKLFNHRWMFFRGMPVSGTNNNALLLLDIRGLLTVSRYMWCHLDVLLASGHCFRAGAFSGSPHRSLDRLLLTFRGSITRLK